VSAPPRETAAELFGILWTVLVGVLGTATVATLMRRAARRATATARDPSALAGFVVVREALEYKVTLPPSWREPNPQALDALRGLVREDLVPLLVELTGPVVVRMLERVPELARHGIVDRREP
jgi:hypothetical protein